MSDGRLTREREAEIREYLGPAETATSACQDCSEHVLLAEIDALRAALTLSRRWSALWKAEATKGRRGETDLLVAVCRKQEALNETLTEREHARDALAASGASRERLRGALDLIIGWVGGYDREIYEIARAALAADQEGQE